MEQKRDNFSKGLKNIASFMLFPNVMFLAFFFLLFFHFLCFGFPLLPDDFQTKFLSRRRVPLWTFFVVISSFFYSSFFLFSSPVRCLFHVSCCVGACCVVSMSLLCWLFSPNFTITVTQQWSCLLLLVTFGQTINLSKR